MTPLVSRSRRCPSDRNGASGRWRLEHLDERVACGSAPSGAPAASPACRRRAGARPRRGPARRPGTGVSSHGARQSRMCCSGRTRSFGVELAAVPVVGARAHDGLRPRAARAVELALHEDVHPLPGHLGRHAEDGHDRSLGHPRGSRRAGQRSRARASWEPAILCVEARARWRSPSSRPSSRRSSRSAASPTSRRRCPRRCARSATRSPSSCRATPRSSSRGSSSRGASRRCASRWASAPFEATVFDGRLASQVDLVVVDVPGLFDRAGVYGERGEDYPDNALRFAALSRAAAELVRQRAATGRPVDVVHCNDWPTALVPTLPEGARRRDARARGDAHGAHHPQRRAPGRLPEGRAADARPGLGPLPRRRHRVLRRHQPAQAGHRDGRRRDDRQPHVRARDPDAGARREARRRARAPGASRWSASVNGVDYAVWNPGDRSRDRRPVRRRGLRQQGALQGRAPEGAGAAASTRARRSSRCVGRMVEQKGTDLVSGRRAQAAARRPTRSSSSPATATRALVVGGRGGGGEGRTGARRSRARRARRWCTASSPGPTSSSCRAGSSRAASCRCTRSATARCRSRTPPGGLVDTIVDCDAKLETGTGFLFDDADRRRAPRRDRAGHRRARRCRAGRASSGARCVSTAAGTVRASATSSSTGRYCSQ